VAAILHGFSPFELYDCKKDSQWLCPNKNGIKKGRTHPQAGLQSALTAWTDGKKHRTPRASSVPTAAGRESHVVDFIVCRQLVVFFSEYVGRRIYTRTHEVHTRKEGSKGKGGEDTRTKRDGLFIPVKCFAARLISTHTCGHHNQSNYTGLGALQLEHLPRPPSHPFVFDGFVGTDCREPLIALHARRIWAQFLSGCENGQRVSVGSPLRPKSPHFTRYLNRDIDGRGPLLLALWAPTLRSLSKYPMNPTGDDRIPISRLHPI